MAGAAGAYSVGITSTCRGLAFIEEILVLQVSTQQLLAKQLFILERALCIEHTLTRVLFK